MEDLEESVVTNYVIMAKVLGWLQKDSLLTARKVSRVWSSAALCHLRVKSPLFLLIDPSAECVKLAHQASQFLSKLRNRRPSLVNSLLMLSLMDWSFPHFKNPWIDRTDEEIVYYASAKQTLPTEMAIFLSTCSIFLHHVRLEIKLFNEEDVQLLQHCLGSLDCVKKLAIDIIDWKEEGVFPFRCPEPGVRRRLETLGIIFHRNRKTGNIVHPPQSVMNHVFSQLMSPSVKFLDFRSFCRTGGDPLSSHQWLEAFHQHQKPSPGSKLEGIKALVQSQTQLSVFKQLSTLPDKQIHLTALNIRIGSMRGRQEGLENVVWTHSSTLVHLDISFCGRGPSDEETMPDPLEAPVTLPRLPRLVTLAFDHGGWPGEGWTFQDFDGLGLQSVFEGGGKKLAHLLPSLSNLSLFFSAIPSYKSLPDLLENLLLPPPPDDTSDEVNDDQQDQVTFPQIKQLAINAETGEGDCERGCDWLWDRTARLFPNLLVLRHLEYNPISSVPMYRTCQHKSKQKLTRTLEKGGWEEYSLERMDHLKDTMQVNEFTNDKPTPWLW